MSPEPPYLFLVGDLASGWGGIRRYGIDVLRAVVQTGARCTAVVLNDPPGQGCVGVPSGVQVAPCALTRWRLVWKLVFALHTGRAVLAARPRLVMCMHVNFLPVVVLLRLLLGIPYVVLTYGIEAWQRPGGLAGAGVRRARGLWSISRYTRERVMAGAREGAPPVWLLPNAVDGERFVLAPKPQDLLERHGLSGRRVMLTVGRLDRSERDKGFETVLLALTRLREKFPDLRYLVVGDGAYREELEARAVALGVRHLVVFAGAVPDAELPRYYHMADVFVMPSKKEGFGFVFLEALASGKPVIAGNRDGSRDPLLDGRLGQLVDPDDAGQVGEAVGRVLEGALAPALLDPAGLRATVLEHYGTARFAERVHALLAMVEGRPDQAPALPAPRAG